MAIYNRALVVTDAPAVYRRFGRVFADLEALSLAEPQRRAFYREAARAVRQAELNFAEDLDRIAKRTAVDAKARIIERLKATQKRKATGKVGIAGAIVCAPLQAGIGNPTGSVGIADEQVLNRLRNPFSPGYGPYWEAQEFGTGSQEVRSQVGRHLYGFFVGYRGGGTPERPLSQYRGGGGPHPIFIGSAAQQALYGGAGFQGGAGVQGGLGGPGTISVEIQARHFIRDGADIARRDWRLAIRAAETRAIDRLLPLVGFAAP